MATGTVHKLTEHEYLAIERAAETKSEFIDGEMFAMSGGTFVHSVLTMDIGIHIGGALLGTSCQPLDSGLRVRVSARAYFYPDVTIVCGQPRFADDEHDVLLNPRVVFEVLSPSTEKYDRGLKSRRYRSIPSLTDYVLVDQTKMHIEHYSRGPGERWSLLDIEGPDSSLTLESIGVSVPLSRIYRRTGIPFLED